MKFPLSWLKDYIDIDLSDEQLSETLTMLGIEVESIEQTKPSFSSVVVAKVISAEKHPNADRLKVAIVDDGTQKMQIVCGASNCREGLITALARVGAVLKDDKGEFTIKQGKLRGVESNGMLCTQKELGLGSQADTIIEFGSGLPLGLDLAGFYSERLVEVSLTPNLGHCSSLIGLARELAAITQRSVRLPDVNPLRNPEISKEGIVRLRIEDAKGAPKYSCALLRDVKVGPSPEWLKKRLESCDIRPINNVVDVTNYVMMELGQPLHAFDYNSLEGATIIVRSASDGEEIQTLDGQVRKLSTGDLLICDAKKPIALAGIMGASCAEVSDATVNVLLEAASFSPSSIRRTSRRLGLITDASWRFERRVDSFAVDFALNRAIQLLQQIASASPYDQIITSSHLSDQPKIVSCRLIKVQELLGFAISQGQIEAIFHRLGMLTRWEPKGSWSVTIPSYRNDIQLEVDLIEEIARIYGYMNIPMQAASYRAAAKDSTPMFALEQEVRAACISEGLQEFLCCDLIGPSILNKVDEKLLKDPSLVHVLNPVSVEQSVLRTSLLPGLLLVAKNNQDRGNRDLSGFELGRIHFREGDTFRDLTNVAFLLMGQEEPHSCQHEDKEIDFYRLKGVVENIFDSLQVKGVRFEKSLQETLHPGRQCEMKVNGVSVGTMGEVHPGVIRRLDLSGRVFFAEINLNDLLGLRKKLQVAKEPPIYPCSERDWTITLPEEMPIQKLLDLIGCYRPQHLEQVSVHALYRGPQVGEGRKNATFHFIYRDQNGTLEQPTVDTEHAKLLDQVQGALTKE